MTDLIPFAYDGQPVRTLTINGEPWFVAADVVRILGYSEAAAMTRTLDDDEKGLRTVQTLGGEQSVSIVSEPGLYSAIIRSRIPEAKAFRRWITHEVIPAIRKHGGYLTPDAIEKTLTDPDFIIRLATDLKAERAKRAELETVVTEQRAHLQLVEPKAAAFDRWLSANVDYSVDQVAKALAATGARLPDGRTVGRNLLLAWMGTPTAEGGPGWVFRNARHQWTPYQQHGPAGAKRLTVKLGRYEDSKTGAEHGTVTVRITPKGAADLAHLLGVLPEPVAQHLEGASDAVA